MPNLRLAAATAAVTALLTAGCASSADSKSSLAATAACDNEPLTYQLGFVPNSQHTGFLVAYDTGLFRKEGVAVEMKPGGPLVNPSLQIAQGTADMTDLPMADGLNALAHGAELSLVAQTAQQNPLRYISAKDVPLSTPNDLKGKTIGVQQAGNVTPELAVLLRGAGLSSHDLTIKQIAFDTSDFLAKKVDVFPLRVYAHIAMLQERGVKYPDDVNVLDPNKLGAGVPDEGIWVNGKFLHEHANTVSCALRAIKAGWRVALANPAEAKRIVGKYAPAAAFSKAAIDVDVDQVLNYVTTTSSGQQVAPLTLNKDYLVKGGRLLQDVGEVPRDVDVAKAIDSEPLDAAQAAPK
jgi:NitT/TauT family transport system substrate-binding protein